MYDAPVVGDLSPSVDVKILFPDDGVIRIASSCLFADPDASLCRRFLERAFLASEIDSAIIRPATAKGGNPAVELRFDATQYTRRRVLEHVAALLG